MKIQINRFASRCITVLCVSALSDCSNDPLPATTAIQASNAGSVSSGFEAASGVPPPTEKDATGVTAHVALVTDRSDSIEVGDGAACKAIVRVTQDLVRGDGLFGAGGPFVNSQLTPGLSSIYLVGTGSTQTPDKPVTLLESTMPSAGTVGEVKRQHGMTPKQAEAKLDEARKQIAAAQSVLNDTFLDKVTSACRSGAEKQGTSGIYAAIGDAASWLTGRCNQAGASCLLIVQSDFFETEERALLAEVKRIEGNKGPGKPTGSWKTIDLQGKIQVLACGFAASTTKTSVTARQAVVQFWKDKVFTNLAPNGWHEQPKCPGYAPDTNFQKPSTP